MLLEHLPGDSAYKTAVRDSIPDAELAEMVAQPPDRHGPWSHEALLLAAVADRLELLRRDLASVNHAEIKGEFEPIRRPGVAHTQRRRKANPAAAALMRQIADEHARLHKYGPYAETG